MIDGFDRLAAALAESPESEMEPVNKKEQSEEKRKQPVEKKKSSGEGRKVADAGSCERVLVRIMMQKGFVPVMKVSAYLLGKSLSALLEEGAHLVFERYRDELARKLKESFE